MLRFYSECCKSQIKSFNAQFTSYKFSICALVVIWQVRMQRQSATERRITALPVNLKLPITYGTCFATPPKVALKI